MRGSCFVSFQGSGPFHRVFNRFLMTYMIQYGSTSANVGNLVQTLGRTLPQKVYDETCFSYNTFKGFSL